MRVLVAVGVLALLGFIGLLLLFSRTFEFREQARRGQPIVRAVDEFKKQTGEYPASLADLVPKYLPTITDIPDESQNCECRKVLGVSHRKPPVSSTAASLSAWANQERERHEVDAAVMMLLLAIKEYGSRAQMALPVLTNLQAYPVGNVQTFAKEIAAELYVRA